MAYLDQEMFGFDKMCRFVSCQGRFSFIKLTLEPVADWIRHWILVPFWQRLLAPRPLGDGAAVPRDRRIY